MIAVLPEWIGRISVVSVVVKHAIARHLQRVAVDSKPGSSNPEHKARCLNIFNYAILKFDMHAHFMPIIYIKVKVVILSQIK